MDFYIINTLTELGIAHKISDSFPTPDQMNFIETIAAQNNTKQALESSPEELKWFEEDGLEGLVTALEFFDKLRNISQRGSYKSASIRMDVQISTRVVEDAPDCKFNMRLKTRDWEKTLNISPATTQKLLDKLLEAKTLIKESKQASAAETE